MLFRKKNIVTAYVNGINDIESEEKVKESISNLDEVISLKFNSKKNKIIINVDDCRRLDLYKIIHAVTDVGCKCSRVKNY